MPSKSNACCALLRPMEIVIRGSVVDTVEELVKTEGAQKKEDKSKIKENSISQYQGSRTGHPTQEGTFADESMIEEGFIVGTIEGTHEGNDIDIEEDNSDNDDAMDA